VKQDIWCCGNTGGEPPYYISRRCSRKGVIERGGKWYCKQHDPEAEKARQVKSTARYARQDAVFVAAVKVAQAERAVLEAVRSKEYEHVIDHYVAIMGAHEDLIEAQEERDALEEGK